MDKFANVQLDTCLLCKKVFPNPRKNKLCPTCYIKMEERFDLVKDYIRENERVGLEEVSVDCEVPKGQILKWVRDERLYFSGESNVGIPCLKCGVSINTGKFCKKCQTQVKQDLKSAYVDKTRPTNGKARPATNKMHFLNKDK